MNEHTEKMQASIEAAMGLRDDVYPCREDVPADLWGVKIERKKDVPSTNDYERGYSKGFLDGFQAARKDPNLVYPNVPNVPTSLKNTCTVCGIDFGNKVWGYVCNVEKCPTKITY
jgi:hypothetical protein